MLASLFHAVGAPPRERSRHRVVRAVRLGARLDSAERAVDGAQPSAVINDWVSSVMADTRCVLLAAADDEYALRAAPDGDVSRSERARHAHETNNGVLQILSGAR